jgi:RNA polymerase sigma factor (sigma-70 family)
MSRELDGITAVTPRSLAPENLARFERALEAEMPLLLASARALLRNESDACDLAQTTLEIAVRKADDLRDLSALRYWLLAIQYREAFRFRRRIGRLIGLSPAVADTLVTGDASADVIALRGALPRLPPRARAAVVLHYLADLPVSEVARTMGISENTAKSNLRAGLARLREELGDD